MPSLTSSGSPTFNGDSSCTIDSTDILQAPASLVNTTQGWIAARVKPSWAAATPPTNPRVFDVQTGAVTRLAQFFTAGNWDFQYASAALVDDLNAGAHIANDHLTLVTKWTAGATIKQSLNGAGFTAGSAITTAASAPDTFTIGNRGAADRPFTGDYYWFLVGTGDPSDADAATINGFGDTDPAWSSIPTTPVFVWYANDLTYLDSNPAASQVLLPTFPRIRFNG